MNLAVIFGKFLNGAWVAIDVVEVENSAQDISDAYLEEIRSEYGVVTTRAVNATISRDDLEVLYERDGLGM